MGKVIMSGIVPQMKIPTLGLPSGYTLLEYIESTKTQYIDTGFKPNQNTRVVMDVQATATNTYAYFGGRNGSLSKSMTFFMISATKVRSDYGSTEIESTVSDPTKRVLIDVNKNTFDYGGITGSHEASTFQSDYTMYLLAVHNGGNASYPMPAKLYSCQIYDNDTLIRDFIPCINPDMEVGLYDKVTKTFFGNAGTGKFNPGYMPGSEEVIVTLENSTWDKIRSISDAGNAANYFAVGDTKTITINGNVGDATFSNLSIDVFIIGIEHNADIEGSNRIHFQLGKIGGVDVSLVDRNYSLAGGNSYFQMNYSSTNAGGWASCDMRNTYLDNKAEPTSPNSGTFLAALPADLRAVMKSVTKYSDHGSGSVGYVASNVSATTDYLWLLAEFEVFGAQNSANSYEKNYQVQYDYYKAGNSKVKYKYNDKTTTVYWFLRSRIPGGTYYFCAVDQSGNANGIMAYQSMGVSPAFAV